MREPWTDVTDDEMTAFLGLCILNSSRPLQEHYEPVSCLWSEQKGRLVFTVSNHPDILIF